MYTHENYPTKKALRAAVKAQATGGPKVTFYQPGPFGGNETQGTPGTSQYGVFNIEGPHFPQPHKWYASCVVENGVIVKVS